MNAELFMRHFHFSTQDLHHNREGKLSLAQQKMLQQERTRLSLGIGVVVLSMFFFVTPMIERFFSVLLGFHSATSFSNFVYLFFAVVPFWWLYSLSRKVKQLTRDLDEAQAHSIEGRAQLSVGNWGERVLVIETHLFVLSGRAFKLMSENVRYRVFFTPHSQHLLSIETLDR